MRYISMKKYNEMDTEIKKEFIKWWGPRVGSKFVHKCGQTEWFLECIYEQDVKELINRGFITEFPLIDVTQLLNFLKDRCNIEIISVKNKKTCHIELVYREFPNISVEIIARKRLVCKEIFNSLNSIVKVYDVMKSKEEKQNGTITAEKGQ